MKTIVPILALAGAFLYAAPQAGSNQFTIPDSHVLTNPGRQIIAISPNGSQVAYAANGPLYLKQAGSSAAAAVPGTESLNVFNPVFSPDGRSIAFWSGADQTLKRIPVTGGTAVTLSKENMIFGMSWGAKDEILFGEALQGVKRVSANGGSSDTIVTMKPQEAAHGPQMLPGGDAVLFTLITLPVSGANPWDNAQIAVQTLGAGQRKVIVEKGSDARYLPTGHIVYAREGTLLAAPFDLKKLELTGTPKAVLQDVRAAFNTGSAQFAAAETGSLIYMPGLRPQYQAALVERNGSRKIIGSLPGTTFAPRISPDGKHVAFDTNDGTGVTIWIADFPTLKGMRRLPVAGQYPLWSADGQRILYISVHEGEQSLFWQRSDGTGMAELLARPARAPEYWSTHLQSVSFITLNNGDYDVWRYSLADKKAVPLVEIPKSSQHSSRISPDGKWLAYVSDETGRFEVYVQPLPVTGTKFRVTKDGGEHPVWSPDGRELFYDLGTKLFATAIRTEPEFSASIPTPLPIGGFVQGVGRRQFDLTADGKQFLMLFPTPSEIRTIPNWFNDLKRLTR